MPAFHPWALVCPTCTSPCNSCPVVPLQMGRWTSRADECPAASACTPAMQLASRWTSALLIHLSACSCARPPAVLREWGAHGKAMGKSSRQVGDLNHTQVALLPGAAPSLRLLLFMLLLWLWTGNCYCYELCSFPWLGVLSFPVSLGLISTRTGLCVYICV